MVDASSDLQAFKFDVRTKTGKEMVALRDLRTGRRFLKRSILFERFVISLDPVPFLIQRGDPIVIKRQIARRQIEGPRRSVLVCEDLFGEKKWKVYAFEPNLTGFAFWQVEFTDCLIATVLFIFQAQGNLSVVFERQHKVLFQSALDVLHIVRRCVPTVAQHVAKPNLIRHANMEQHSETRVFGHATTTLLFAGFGINVPLGLRHQIEGDWQSNLRGLIERRDEIDSFDTALFCMIPVPANQIVLVGIGLLFDAIVEDQNPVVALDLTHKRLDHAPQIGAGLGRRG